MNHKKHQYEMPFDEEMENLSQKKHTEGPVVATPAEVPVVATAAQDAAARATV